jgi:PQQ-like domain
MDVLSRRARRSGSALLVAVAATGWFACDPIFGIDEGTLVPAAGDGGGLDATESSDGGGDVVTSVDAGADASDGSTSDASTDAFVGPPYDGGFSPPSDCDLGGTAAGAAWPQEGYCATHRNRSPYAASAGAVSISGPFYVPGTLVQQPAIGADGSLYVSSYGNTIDARNADGSFKWHYADDAGGAQFHTMPVLAADGTLRAYDFALGVYVVLDPTTGNVVDRRSVNAIVGGGLTLVTGAEYLVDDDTTALESRSADGGLIWQGAHADSLQIPTVAHDGTIVVVEDGTLTSVSPDGGLRWSVSAASPSDGFNGVAIATNGAILGYTGESNVLASYDLVTHALNWATSIDAGSGGEIHGFAIADDGTIVVATSTHGLVRVSSAGSAIGTAFDARCDTPTIDAAGNVIALCNSSIVCVSADLSTQHWAVSVPTPPDSYDSYVAGVPVVGPNGIVYFSMHNGLSDGGSRDAIYAIGP